MAVCEYLLTAGELRGVFAGAQSPGGAVLVVHENRGLTDHVAAVTGRLAGDGYAALAVDLLSLVGGTSAVPDVTAALSGLTEADLVADLSAGLDELGRRAAGKPLGATGFCFGGSMVWRLLDAGAPAVAAAVPFYGPVPEGASFDGSRAAVLGVFAELDDRVNAGIERAERALTETDLVHELRVVPDVDHAFFNDTGPRFDLGAARTTYAAVLAWFAEHLR